MTCAQPFRLAVTVYYEDTDAAGVVYYANYLKFMERARTEWLGAHGFPLASLERDHGVVFVVRHVDIHYHRAGRLNDRLEATVEVVDRGASRLVLRQDVTRANDALTHARVTLACLDRERWRPTRIPVPLVAALENTK
ncbi:MAG TPA: tol-pal system-associated acyl-CoA thioesterase [Casimicrobiaceae bacterium]|nr:tol-pal system-associated acyl-CoA thioesterase [Casimicrobiaceae bacterium]